MKKITQKNMKMMKLMKTAWVIGLFLITFTACDDQLDEPLDNEVLLENIDYTQTENMFELLKGSYADFYSLQWETFPTISVRGDDVNAAGDQAPLQQTDEFNYDPNAWMYNNSWQNLYTDIIATFYLAIEEIEKYNQFADNPSEGEQFIAEIKVMIGFELFQITRLWGDVLIPTTSDASDLYGTAVTPRAEVLQYISDLMDEAILDLPSVHPNQRTDIPGGMTEYTALAIKALANLENENWQGVADATSSIINSGLFSLSGDYYNLFKIPGKLDDEIILELQYSDFNTGSGEERNYLNASLGINQWTPAVAGAGAGWGFWEPTMKYIQFMLDRGETERLETSVLFTPDGIQDLVDAGNTSMPAFVSNVTRDGDQINNSVRMKFGSGKHYLPSVQLIPGRTNYGSNKNFICIRYAEVLLMHAEALVSGASSTVLSADEAVTLVRNRAGLGNATGVTLQDVIDEKYAEFGMEWGIRFYDLVRHGMTDELNHEGKTYNEEDRFLPYPLNQATLLPQLNND